MWPIRGDHTSNHRRGHGDHLQSERAERSHAAQRIAEKLILGKAIDQAPGEPAMTLPMGQQSIRCDEWSQFSGHFSGHATSANIIRQVLSAWNKG
jgi:hypothetical protein